MIGHISIRDFAIIENIDIDLHAGFNVLTGETGSGKSIIIEAVSLAFGARADTSMVRTGTGKALIQVVIDEDELPEDLRTGIELISREISAAGKSICRVNGEIVTLAQLAASAARLADIHGQYDHQSLLDPENHIGIIDAFRTGMTAAAAERVRNDYENYAVARKNLNEILSQEALSRRELDFITYEVDEIEKARLVPGEHAELKEQIALMQNSEKIFAALSDADNALSAEGGAVDGIANALSAVRLIAEYSADYAETERALANSYFELTEAARRIGNALDHTDFSQRSIDEAIARLDTIDRLIAKYGAAHADADAETAVLSHLDAARKKLDSFENIDARKAELNAALENSIAALAKSSRALHTLRVESAELLSARVKEQLTELNFKDAQFAARFEELPESDAELSKRFSAGGVDKVEFVFTANKGQPLRPIAKVASGGEMSRVMLAIKTVTGDFDGIPTMIFDEIDTGISGVTASVVGEKLKRMSATRQIVCITHLPQIAGFAGHHYLIEKSSDESSTRATVRELDGDEKITAIARLIGGKTITPATLESAQELMREE
ncbi:MAG: DNA repair protein RecN [Clostridiales Family XIII bacterium]|jgi:DNA repair protein RecN (Recombination protein N)|nr:DNA repair protein RecN [Clostridiales Family XIII bacterium]